MDKYVFADGLKELQRFFPTLKLEGTQLKAIYERLKHFENDEWRLAVYDLSEHQRTTPKYADMRDALFKAKKRINKPGVKIAQAQGWAPMTDEKRQLCQDHVRQLLAVMGMPKADQPAAEKDLKKMWANTYPKLPGYRSAREIHRMIEQRQWDKLIELGFMMEAPTDESVFIPPFSNEQTTDVVEVAHYGN